MTPGTDSHFLLTSESTSDRRDHPVVIIGAGPAGLTAAYELAEHGVRSLVLEKADKVGGISRTEVYKGYRFDIGGHRFYTKNAEVQALWHRVLGSDLIKVPRLSRIYYQGKFFDYPLSLFDTLANLGLGTSLAILLSYFKAKLRAKLKPQAAPTNFEDWVIDRFGRRLYHTFFKTYTEKVWGIPCHKIQAEWASQRIQDMSLKRAVLSALSGKTTAKSLIKEFEYPRLGPGMMWERFQQEVEQRGATVELNSTVTSIQHNGSQIQSIQVRQAERTFEVTSDYFISSMPISLLVKRLNPLPPASVLLAANGLKYRDFLIVTLIIEQVNLFPDNWLYIHSPEFKVGRIQNFNNWSAEMVPDSNTTCLGMEYFCNEGEPLWEMSDADLIQLATTEIAALGLLAQPELVKDGAIIRQPKAYPVYDGVYRQHLTVLQDYLSRFENLQTIGRNGMHRYNNQDHSMLTGLLAARNIMGGKRNLWTINTERSYYEDFTREEWSNLRKSVKIDSPQPLAMAKSN